MDLIRQSLKTEESDTWQAELAGLSPEAARLQEPSETEEDEEAAEEEELLEFGEGELPSLNGLSVVF